MSHSAIKTGGKRALLSRWPLLRDWIGIDLLVGGASGMFGLI